MKPEHNEALVEQRHKEIALKIHGSNWLTILERTAEIVARFEQSIRTTDAARIARLEHALEPFTRQNPHKSEDGSSGILVPATVADVRLARATLRSSPDAN